MRCGVPVVAAAVVVLQLLVPLTAQAGDYDVPPSIDSTGGTDTTKDLQEFFDGVPDASRVRFAEGGTYRLDGTLQLVGKRALTILGQGATLRATTEGDRVRSQLRVIKATDLVIEDLVVRGANPQAGTGEAAYKSTREAQHAFDLLGVRGAVLRNVQAYDVYGDFVYMGKSGDQWTTDVLVTGSTFERTGRQGIALTAARSVVIRGNKISQTRRATFDLEPNSAEGGVADVLIEDNDVGPGRLNFLSAHGAGLVDDVTVRRNRLTGRAMNSSIKAPEGLRRHGWRYLDNVADTGYGSPGGAVMGFTRVDDVEVTGNTQPVQAGREMVLVRGIESCRVTVRDNEVRNSAGQARVDPYDCPRLTPTPPLETATPDRPHPAPASTTTGRTPTGPPTLGLPTSVSGAPASTELAVGPLLRGTTSPRPIQSSAIASGPGTPAAPRVHGPDAPGHLADVVAAALAGLVGIGALLAARRRRRSPDGPAAATEKREFPG